MGGDNLKTEERRGELGKGARSNSENAGGHMRHQYLERRGAQSASFHRLTSSACSFSLAPCYSAVLLSCAPHLCCSACLFSSLPPSHRSHMAYVWTHRLKFPDRNKWRTARLRGTRRVVRLMKLGMSLVCL